MQKVLLHCCCGVCSLYSIMRLQEEGYFVKCYFYNPNIHPKNEYEKRKFEMLKIQEIYKVEVIEGEYETNKWFEVCRNHKNDKEGERRCFLCYSLRLKETYIKAKYLNFDYFSSTLTISPHKNSVVINTLGQKIGGSMYLSKDFKKKDGYKTTIDLAKKHNFYRQNYCGCLYSKISTNENISVNNRIN